MKPANIFIILAFLSPHLVSSLAHMRRQYRVTSTTRRYIDYDFDSSEEKGSIPSNQPTGSIAAPYGKTSGKNVEMQCHRYLEQAADSQYEPACGTDGKTYSNKLYLAYQNCLDEFKGFPKVTVQYVGECSNKEERVTCTSLIDQVNPVYDPVCGSDQNTYTSVDDLNFQNCLNREQGKPGDVAVLHPGECEVEPSEQNKEDCNVLLAKAKQSRPDPVCGSDGKTHINIEEIAYENCILQQNGKQKLIDVINSGTCYTPSSPRTPDNRPHYCLSLMDRTKLNDHKPVCGSDGQTYINKNFVTLANCINQISGEQPVTIVDDGECYSNCPTTYNIPSEYVCGSDEETYNNIQALERRNCLKKLKGRDKIKPIHQGFCIKLPYKGMIWV